MNNVKLFYFSVVAKIRAEQAEHLKKEKMELVVNELPKVDYVTAEEVSKMKFLQRIVYRLELRRLRKRYNKLLRAQKPPVDERLLRGYNAGVEMALNVLKRGYMSCVLKTDRNEDE